LNFIDVATGSLGQGLSCAAGMAYMGKYVDKASYRVYCLLGDGESAEGAVWEAASFASHYKLDNLVGVVDVNSLGQSCHTQLAHDLNTYAARFEAFGWHAVQLDGHDIPALLRAYADAKTVKGKPTMILAKTNKGHGITGVESLEGFHGKPVEVAKAEDIRKKLRSVVRNNWTIPKPVDDAPAVDLKLGSVKLSSGPDYKMGEKVATRAAYGTALLKLADNNKRVIALDGDMKNSTFSEKVAKKYPEQFVECFIAEQNMIGVGVGMACRDRCIPFASTFAAFLLRGADQVRMAAVSFANLKLVGSHCGISIGEDGPSQMALEDLAFFRAIPGGAVLYPSDAVSTERATELAANRRGIVFIRTSRPNLPVIYGNDETFDFGKAKIVRQSPEDKVVIIGAGVTLHEAIGAHDILAKEGIKVSVVDIFSIHPVDGDLLEKEAKRVGGRIITVEDHYQAGGIGEAVCSTLAHLTDIRIRSLFVKEVPRSGAPEVLLDHYGLSAKHIVEAVKKLLQ
jgi:transketolase